ncbi:uncharacterized protein LOC126661145 [Mercurialis annua]|uniref:uncharacterized protein LOC126661145 n=1 Tax=Mercurialis annua TaxID=3986 RepID=UPI002160A276|nr:uncharacterized protein LOC126661145 [Mercurialis annua]
MASPASKPSNPRNSEVVNPMRRSSNGNPFAKPSIIANPRSGFNPNTPANSPSDFSLRNSVGREFSEDKENGKDQKTKQEKVRSPAALKGAKHFMSPTISAASKINPSPRKKILMDRNEPIIRSSMSFSDGKSPLNEDLGIKPEKGLNQKKEVKFDPTVTYLEDLKSDDDDVDSSSKDDSDSLSESVVTMGSDCVNLDPSFNISPRTSCSLPIPDLDADPSMPPYDPKTNYLSPRPQYLYYKPNPRIELYLNKERDGKQLDEIFASESSSDAEVTEEETQSVDSQKESDSSSSDIEAKEDDLEEEIFVCRSDSTAVTAKRSFKPSLFTRTKLTALLFVLGVACLWASVTNSPVMEPSVLNNLSFSSNLYVPPEISEFTRNNLESLTQKLRQWLYDSLFYLQNLITTSFMEQRKSSPLQFANLSILIEDGLLDNNVLLVAHSTFKFDSDVNIQETADVKILEKEDEVAVIEVVAAIEEVAEVPIEAAENFQEVVEGDDGEHGELDDEVISALDFVQYQVLESDEVIVTESDNLASQVTPEMVEIPQDVPNTVHFLSGTDVDSNSVAAQNSQTEDPASQVVPEMVESLPDVSDSEHFLAGADVESNSVAVENSQIEEPLSLTAVAFVMAISFIVLSALAAVAFVHIKNRTSSTQKSGSTGVNKLPLPSRNLQTEVETIAVTCPSEMSSFKYSSSAYYSKHEQKGMAASEAQSQERKTKRSTRRESMATSDCSMDSPSYGSFTTYEKITNNHGNGEENGLTPVRRSSRIRKQVTSP